MEGSVKKTKNMCTALLKRFLRIKYNIQRQNTKQQVLLTGSKQLNKTMFWNYFRKMLRDVETHH